MRILKFALPTDKVTISVQMPYIFEVLKFDLQNGQPTMWCISDEKNQVYYKVEALYTGDEIPIHSLLDHTGTIKIKENFILHYHITEV